MMALQKCVVRTTAEPTEALMCGALRHSEESCSAKKQTSANFTTLRFEYTFNCGEGLVTTSYVMGSWKRGALCSYRGRRLLIVLPVPKATSLWVRDGYLVRSSAEQERCLTTSAVRLWHFRRLQTLCTVVISHIRKHSPCWMKVTLTTEKQYKKQYFANIQKQSRYVGWGSSAH